MDNEKQTIDESLLELFKIELTEQLRLYNSLDIVFTQLSREDIDKLISILSTIKAVSKLVDLVSIWQFLEEATDYLTKSDAQDIRKAKILESLFDFLIKLLKMDSSEILEISIKSLESLYSLDINKNSSELLKPDIKVLQNKISLPLQNINKSKDSSNKFTCRNQENKKLTKVLVFKNNDVFYVLALNEIDRIIKVNKEIIFHIDNQIFIPFNNNHVLLFSFDSTVGKPYKEKWNDEFYVIIFFINDKYYGLIVNDFFSIKPLIINDSEIININQVMETIDSNGNALNQEIKLLNLDEIIKHFMVQ